MTMKIDLITCYLGFLIIFAVLVNLNLIRNVIKIGALRIAGRDHCFILLISVYSLVQSVPGSFSVFTGRFLQDGIANSAYLCNTDGFVTFCAVAGVISAIAVWSNVEEFTRRIPLYFVIPMISLWSVILTSPPLLLSIGKYVPHGNDLYCCLNWTSSSSIDKSYFYTLLFLVFLLPVVMIIYGYLNSKWYRSCTTVTYDHEPKTPQQLSPATIKFLCGIIILLLWLPFGCYVIYLLFGYEEIYDVCVASLLLALSSSLLVPMWLHFTLNRFCLKK